MPKFNFKDTFAGFFKNDSPEIIKPAYFQTKGCRYEINKKIAQGGSGTVYKVWDKVFKRYLVAKVSQTSKEKSIAEAQMAGELDHQNIVRIHDIITHENISYIIMEYIEGPTLREFCSNDNLLPPEKVLEIILYVCVGLDYAHNKGVIHRDIKPSNIILDRNGSPKITDFGVAQLVETTLQLGFFGTPNYISPEQLNDEAVITNKSDIFSLGCVFYELLKGEKAFSGENAYSTIYKVINEEPAPITNLPPKIQPTIEKLIRKALQKDPEKRYQDCHKFAYDLSKTLGQINSLLD